MNITYGIVEEIYTHSNETRTAYGIVAYSDADSDKTATIVAAIHDVTGDKQKLLNLITLCNELHLSVIHLGDVVEDFLADR